MNVLASLASGPAATWIDILGLALLHFLWQGTLIAGGLALALKLIDRSAAQLRYGLACAALLLLAAAPVLTVAWLLVSVEGHDLHRQMLSGVPFSGGSRAPGPGFLAVAPRGFHALLPWAVGLWMLGVGIASARFFHALGGVGRLRDHNIRPLEPVWGAVLEELRQSMGIRRAVRVVESTVATVPTVIGWLRPVILVPTCALTGLAPGHLRALLAHELGHVRRHDYLVNLMQALLECLLFYHPAVWWISTRIRQEREFCCDDLAAAACGDVLLYARALAELEHTREPAPMLALGANGSPLMQRIRRLVGNRGGERRRVPVLPGLLVLALAAAAPVTALAQQDPGEKLCPRCAAIVRGMLPDQDPQPEPPIRHLRRGTLPGRQDGARGLRGHVVDPSGAPLPGAVIVSTRDGENSASGLLSLRVLPQLGTDGLMELNTWIEKSDELAGRRIVVSDSDGRFEVRAIGDDGEMAQLHGVLRSEPAKTKEYRVIIVDENGRRAHSLEGEIDDPENPGEIDAFMEFEFDDEDSADPETMDLLLHTAAESGDGEVKVKVIRKGMQAPRAGERTYDVRVADDSDETDGDGEHQVFEYRRHEGDGEPFGDLLAIDVDENGEAGQRYGFLRRRLGAAAPGRYFLRWEQDGGEENAAIDVHRNGGVERLILRPGETFDPQSLLLRSPELRRTLMLGGQNLRGVRFRDAIEAPAECKAECCQPAEAAKVKVEAKKRGSIYL